ncbi:MULTISPECIES: hypothetical protein [Comamonas]|uniref:hypothetical protein n=1 Tax=Comamonas TaxID=283 RepID=UPI0006B8BDF6|nr:MULTISPECIES: hypothetical protein [Comamonas]
MTQPPKSADEIVDEPFRPSSPQPRAFLILGANSMKQQLNTQLTTERDTHFFLAGWKTLA